MWGEQREHDMSLTIHKVIWAYRYPRNGNMHNPTPLVRWEVRDNGKLIDSCRLLRQVRADYPDATLIKEQQQ